MQSIIIIRLCLKLAAGTNSHYCDPQTLRQVWNKNLSVVFSGRSGSFNTGCVLLSIYNIKIMTKWDTCVNLFISCFEHFLKICFY